MESKIIIWDIDGVLIYVGDSYRKAIVDTVQYYFAECIGLELDGYLMDGGDTQSFKLAGGFNDDWELTYAAVLCFLSKLVDGIDKSRLDLESTPGDLDGMLKRLGFLGSVCSGGSPELDLRHVLQGIRGYGGGLTATEKALSEFFGGSLEFAGKFWFPDLLKRIFEEIYLGEGLFYSKYREKPRFSSGRGLISNERALVDLKTLLELRRRYYMGIATGRERFEAEFSIKHHGFGRVFPSDLIVARGDTVERKPSPKPLLECKKRICGKYKLGEDAKAAYIGDSLDDLRAAKNAGFQFIAVLSGIAEGEGRDTLRGEFRGRGCDLVLDDLGELVRYM